ncbi:MAG: hypothetical protein PSX80_07155 [bacterium]|nr:hypothetical protein [bacterium]
MIVCFVTLPLLTAAGDLFAEGVVVVAGDDLGGGVGVHARAAEVVVRQEGGPGVVCMGRSWMSPPAL